MTIEEKAKAYDEAIKVARPLYERAKKDGCPIWSTYETIFPELRESEDERIRKEILECIETLVKQPGASPRLCDWISWLEKQKEQKPVDEEELSKFCEANFNAGKRVVLNNPEEYGLQKPLEWSEEDDDGLAIEVTKENNPYKNE